MSSAAVVAEALRARRRFILTSHARPDGDAVGSQVALALALDHLGKEVRLVDRDPVPAPYRDFPAVDRIEVAPRADGDADAVVVLECSDLTRPQIEGLDRPFIVNIDHHLGNEMYGTVNWFDVSAAACGEMVADVIDALGVPWSPDMAAHLYLAIATDTGSFRYGPVSARTFEICRRIVETGVDTSALSRRIFDSYSVGRVLLTGALLNAMELHHERQLAYLYFDDEILTTCGATADDAEGLVNLPLGADQVVATILCKRQPDRSVRVSLRSKGEIDVRAVALHWQGGGHRNAAGCTLSGEFATAKPALLAAMKAAIDERRPAR